MFCTDWQSAKMSKGVAETSCAIFEHINFAVDGLKKLTSYFSDGDLRANLAAQGLVPRARHRYVDCFPA